MIRPVRPVVLLPLTAMLGACASVSPGMPPRAHGMTLDATLQREASDTGSAGAELVLSSVRVTDSAGTVLMAPRLLVKVGEPASIRIGTDTAWTDIQVTTRREGSAVLVDAALSESGGPVRIRAQAQAIDAPAAAGAK